MRPRAALPEQIPPDPGDAPAAPRAGQPGGPDRSEPHAVRPACILVVDDEIDIREALEWTLRRAGYDVLAADGGRAAVSAAESRHFDLVVTDYRMPGMNGAQTIIALKRLDPKLPIIVATGYFSDDTAAECRAEGADDFIKKPFDVDELLAKVKRLLS